MDRNNRTWLCSILFLDIVGYSKLFVDKQLEIKQHFTNMISESLKDLAERDLILLDTGDGMAISYLGDPEDMLFVAIGLRDAFAVLEQELDHSYQVRLGINLGPVKIIEDINGNRNIVGDGINVAQRIMDFAGPNQLYVSRSFFDVVSCLDNNYQEIFKYLGRRADKHVRQHAVYEVLTEGESEGGNGLADDEAVAIETSSTTLDEKLLNKISTALADHIGPMAKIIVSRQAEKSESIDELVKAVAKEITNGDDQQKFLNTWAV